MGVALTVKPPAGQISVWNGSSSNKMGDAPVQHSADC